MSKSPYIYVHADDYGMTPVTCRRIQDCWKNGCLNRISVVPNGCIENAFQGVNNAGIPCAIHINLVEGKGLMPADKINLLAGPDGYMNNSFFGLLMLSLSSKRKQLEKQLYLEIREQIFSVMEYLKDGEDIILDSHQHTHMIPLIFHTILKVVEDNKIPVRFMRIPAEPIIPFLLEPSLYFTYNPINLIKNRVLNFLWMFDRKAFQKSGIQSALFCGIIFSGNMDEKRVMKIFPHFYRKAKKLDSDLEFLFHPGYVKQGEQFFDPNKKSFHHFYLSQGRINENDALHSKKWCELVKKINGEIDNKMETIDSVCYLKGNCVRR